MEHTSQRTKARRMYKKTTVVPFESEMRETCSHLDMVRVLRRMTQGIVWLLHMQHTCVYIYKHIDEEEVDEKK